MSQSLFSRSAGARSIVVVIIALFSALALSFLSGCSSSTSSPDAQSPASSAAGSDGANSTTDSPTGAAADSSPASRLHEPNHKPVISVSSSTFPLTVTDIHGDETRLDKRPESVVFLSGTPLNLWYSAGGKAVARPELTKNIRLVEDKAEEIMALPSVGMPYAINTEAVAGHRPDLIVGMQGPHDDAIAHFLSSASMRFCLRCVRSMTSPIRTRRSACSAGMSRRPRRPCRRSRLTRWPSLRRFRILLRPSGVRR